MRSGDDLGDVGQQRDAIGNDGLRWRLCRYSGRVIVAEKEFRVSVARGRRDDPQTLFERRPTGSWGLRGLDPGEATSPPRLTVRDGSRDCEGVALLARSVTRESRQRGGASEAVGFTGLVRESQEVRQRALGREDEILVLETQSECE
jgi:hypothetical protein